MIFCPSKVKHPIEFKSFVGESRRRRRTFHIIILISRVAARNANVMSRTYSKWGEKEGKRTLHKDRWKVFIFEPVHALSVIRTIWSDAKTHYFHCWYPGICPERRVQEKWLQVGVGKAEDLVLRSRCDWTLLYTRDSTLFFMAFWYRENRFITCKRFIEKFHFNFFPL